MAVGSFTGYYEGSQKANFLTWGQGLYTALTSTGFTSTGDTGQINFGSLPASVGSNVDWGFNVFKFNDTLQASFPFLMKVRYSNGQNTGTNNIPTLYLQFSTATDGAGNCTGNVSPVMLVQGTTNATAAVAQQNVYAGGTSTGTSSGAWFSAVMWDGSSFQNPWYLSIERTNDGVTGASTSDGIIINVASSAGGVYSFVLPNSLYIPLSPNTTFNVPLNLAQSSMAGSGVVGVSFPIPFNGRPYNYGLGCCVYQASDFGPQSTTTFSVYGSNHTYRAPTVTLPINLVSYSGAARIQLRYE